MIASDSNSFITVISAFSNKSSVVHAIAIERRFPRFILIQERYISAFQIAH